MTAWAHLVSAGVALIGLLLKIRDLRRNPGNPALRAICITLAGLCGAVLAGWDPVAGTIDSVSHVPNLAKLLEHCLALTAAAATQALFLNLGDPSTAGRRSRYRWLILVGVVAVMTTAFALGGFRVEAPETFVTYYAGSPYLAPYLLAYLAYLALAMVDIFRMSFRYARHAPGRLLRTGIRLLATGSIIGLVYVVHKAAFTIAHRLDVSLAWDEGLVSRLLTLAGIAFVTTGLTLPALGAFGSDIVHWPARHRLHQHLYDLWAAVTDAVPEVVLYPAADSGRRRLVLRGLQHALYRRVIEIHDGLLRLRPYADPADVAAARDHAADLDLPGAVRDAVLDAATIASAIRRRPTHSAMPTDDVTAPDAAPGDFDSAAAHLARVADAFTASPVIARIRNGGLAAARAEPT
ncbi:hypothetical protein ODJ79_39875 [Actinoplanes sp. KI2]|uniref:MAB_1171c family putative transporter n=1 Tax=Actinoplanes sp. KI2 TaxID=2983315 RepID=UPI0021D5AE79|nr:MAB_1171c family putative transporter [Actinoplanes sp. KI2]MCU7729912.1 hypothetical protein [Actinoplanes sp. KI2]